MTVSLTERSTVKLTVRQSVRQGVRHDKIRLILMKYGLFRRPLRQPHRHKKRTRQPHRRSLRQPNRQASHMHH